MKQPHLILGIGELLWDLLPEGPKLGGAPANFAVMAARLGDRAAILSRIGRDDLGRQAIDQLEPLPVDTTFIQTDPGHPTGQVSVEFHDGQPVYTIHRPSAWDFLEPDDNWINLVESAGALCFGSLAQRSPISRQTIQMLAAEASADSIRVFDVNLRPPFVYAEVIEESLDLATVLKMNDAELPQILDLLGMPGTAEPPGFDDPGAQFEVRSSAHRLLSEFPSLKMVAITRGSHGSLLVTRDEWHNHPGFPVKVSDPVGAGDAFTASLVHYLLRGASLATLNEAGNRWGAWVASQSGAMPHLPDAVLTSITGSIES